MSGSGGAVDPADLTVDADSPVPPYEQVRARLAAQVADGRLAAGTRLPTVRALAQDLGLAVNTVAKAYRELEAAGLVETRGRGGTVVTAQGDRARETLQRAAQGYVDTARALGVPADDALALVRAAMSADRRTVRP